MAGSVKEVMTKDPICVPATATAREAAQAMRDAGVGDVIIMRDGKLGGILTDRDIAVRAVAEGKDPNSVKVGEIASKDVQALSPKDTLDQAIKLMREKAVRRLPVVDGDRPVGMVSLGDLALNRDPDSALAGISGAPPNR